MPVSWMAPDGRTVQADETWLRSICRCRECGDSTAGLRWFSPHELVARPETCRVDSLDVDTDAVHVVFVDGHRSTHDRGALEHRLLGDAADAAPARSRPSLVDAALQSHDAELCRTDDAALHAAIEELVVDGVARFDGVPASPEATAAFAGRFGPVRVTSYGAVQEFRTVAEPKTAAETGRAQIPHTDEPFRYSPPGFLFFHSATAAPAGQGSTILVDGFAVAEQLRDRDPDAFHTLAAIPVPLHRRHADQVHFRTHSRVITVGPDDAIEAIRLNTRCLDDLDPLDRDTGRLLDALGAFTALVADAANQRVVHLNDGDMLAFDNHRIMHGRSAFSAARHLLSCNVDRDAVHSTWRVLSERFGRPVRSAPQGPTT